MYRKGDILKVDNPQGIYGGFDKVIFEEDAVPVHGNPLKYMAKIRAICDDYECADTKRILICKDCRHHCTERQYMIKYIGAFGEESRAEEEMLSPENNGVAAAEWERDRTISVDRPDKRTPEPTKRRGSFFNRITAGRGGATNLTDWDDPDEEQGSKDGGPEVRHVDRNGWRAQEQSRKSAASNSRTNAMTGQKTAYRERENVDSGSLDRERILLAQQADFDGISPFLMQTMLSGKADCHGVPVDYVILDYVQGKGLGEYISVLKNMEGQNHKEADRRRMDVIRQLLYAVRACAKQQQGIYNVHRDLKPDNIHVLAENYGDVVSHQLQLLDFDMLIRQNDIRTDTMYLGGTVGYVHPEANRLAKLPASPSRQFSHRWDLYAVGLIMYEIMEGERHFKDGAYLESDEMAYVLRPMAAGKTYPELERIIQKLITNGEDGYSDIDEVIDDFHRFLENSSGRWYYDYYMDQWLECRPGYEQSLPGVSIRCVVRAEGLKDCGQNFCIYANTVTSLVYGRNLIGRERGIQEEAGAFVCCSSMENDCLELYFAPLSRKCRINGEFPEEGLHGISVGDVVTYRDITMTIKQIKGLAIT